MLNGWCLESSRWWPLMDPRHVSPKPIPISIVISMIKVPLMCFVSNILEVQNKRPSNCDLLKCFMCTSKLGDEKIQNTSHIQILILTISQRIYNLLLDFNHTHLNFSWMTMTIMSNHAIRSHTHSFRPMFFHYFFKNIHGTFFNTSFSKIKNLQNIYIYIW